MKNLILPWQPWSLFIGDLVAVSDNTWLHLDDQLGLPSSTVLIHYNTSGIIIGFNDERKFVKVIFSHYVGWVHASFLKKCDSMIEGRDFQSMMITY